MTFRGVPISLVRLRGRVGTVHRRLHVRAGPAGCRSARGPCVGPLHRLHAPEQNVDPTLPRLTNEQVFVPVAIHIAARAEANGAEGVSADHPPTCNRTLPCSHPFVDPKRNGRLRDVVGELGRRPLNLPRPYGTVRAGRGEGPRTTRRPARVPGREPLQPTPTLRWGRRSGRRTGVASTGPSPRPYDTDRAGRPPTALGRLCQRLPTGLDHALARTLERAVRHAQCLSSLQHPRRV